MCVCSDTYAYYHLPKKKCIANGIHVVIFYRKQIQVKKKITSTLLHNFVRMNKGQRPSLNIKFHLIRNPSVGNDACFLSGI